MGNEAAALAKYEESARCKPSDAIHMRAGVTACRLYRRTKQDYYASKAKLYIGKLPEAKRESVRQFCTHGCDGPGLPEPGD